MDKKYWKVRFDGETDYTEGWLVFNAADMVAERLTDVNGNTIREGVSYTPVEFDTQPDWA
jgi:hypothetical protein